MVAPVGDALDAIYSSVGDLKGANRASVSIAFVTGFGGRDREKEMVKEVMKIVKTFGKERNIDVNINLQRPGPPMGKPIEIEVTSREFSVGEKIVTKLKKSLEKVKGVHSLETDLSGGSQWYHLRVNNEWAVAEGVDPQKVARTIFTASTGRVVSEVLKKNQKIEILLKVEDKKDSPVEYLLDLKMRNKRGQAVPLKEFVEIVEKKGPSSIERLNGLRTITLFGEVNENIITGKEANAQIRPIIKDLRKKNQTVRFSIGGREKDRMDAFSDTMKLYEIIWTGHYFNFYGY